MKFTLPKVPRIPFLILAATVLIEPATAQNRPKISQPDVSMIGAPKWWIVPHQEGNTSEGYLYFGAILQNNSDVAVKAGLSFQSYLADGTKFEGCYSPGGGGPGVTQEIAAHEKALLVCNRATVRRDLKNLQVTSRLWDVYQVRKNIPGAKVVESGLTKPDWGLDKQESKYDAFARVQTLGKSDIKVRVLFRFYSEDGIQVATCESDDVSLEHEVVLKVTCDLSVFVDAGSPQPKSVRAEVGTAKW